MGIPAMSRRNTFRLLGVVALAAAPLGATATRVTGVDVLTRWQHERMTRLGASEALGHSNATLVRQMLATPASPYSEPVEEPGFTNEVDWAETLDRIPGGPLSSSDALTVMRWDLGMTRARPGVDITIKSGYRDDFAAASAIKADIDPDIFWHVLDLTGYSHSAKGATYAVGLQILRRQLAEETDADRRATLSIDPDVFARAMRARNIDEVTEYDLNYLSTLVQHRLLHWKVGERASTGLRALPVAYRIARVAAAYRDLQGYTTAYPCRRDATPVASYSGSDGSDPPLCFVAATDRAVHRWYLDEYRRQARRVTPQHESGLARFAGFAGAILALVDIVGMLEIVEAVIADDLLTAEAITSPDAEFAAERADLLSCRIPE
jgi:hypothetical protein